MVEKWWSFEFDTFHCGQVGANVHLRSARDVYVVRLTIAAK